MKEFLASLVTWGAPGLLLAAVLDGAGLPIPGGVDVLVMYLASQTPEQTFWLATLAVLGSVIGNYLLFLIARRGGKAFLEKHSTSRRSKRFRHWFDTYGLLTVFVSALVPLPVMPMKIFVVSAGALGSSPLRFLVAFLSARIPRYLGLALLGRTMGHNAMAYLKSHVWHLVGFAVALLVLLSVIAWYTDKRWPAKAATD